ncbi:LysR family transcriptional regulator [Mesorhizobium waimense]|uniref:LysR family transcriptional regulator n=1 Tax=Mesorhizobium waimense TaxID=1300307 RepID=UPI00142D8993|nr:LysR family transcriptional regulator [Mesorhizobium waimense]
MNKFDINLLVVFDAVWDVRSVTKAGVRLHLTQPAVSHALGRLRVLLGDPLFIRGQGELMPTARAVELAAAVKDVLRAVEKAVGPPRFDPQKTTRTFTLGGSEFTSITLLPLLGLALHRDAPHAALRLRMIDSAVLDLLTEDQLDLVFWATEPPGDLILSAELFRESHLVLVGAQHPLAADKDRRTISLEDYLAFPHLRVNFTTTAPSLIDNALASIAERRSIAFETPYIAATLSIIRSSTLIMTVPSRLANAFGDEGLVFFPVPFPVPELVYRIIWHQKNDKDLGLIWLRQKVLEATRSLTQREQVTSSASL